MIAGTDAESAIETLRWTEHAAALGYDVCSVRAPHYYKQQMQPLNLLSFYRFVADRSPLPVVIYNTPHTTGYDMPVEVVVELAGHPNVAGIKELSGSLEKLRAIAGLTRHIHRAATVTERFEPVTGRMLKVHSNKPAEGSSGTPAAAAGGSEAGLVPAEMLAASAGPHAKPSSTAVQVIGKLRTRQKDAGFQIMIAARSNCSSPCRWEPAAPVCPSRPPLPVLVLKSTPPSRTATPVWPSKNSSGLRKQPRAS